MKVIVFLGILLLLFLTPCFAQIANAGSDIRLGYLECKGNFAVFVLQNKSAKPIYVRASIVPSWKDWKKARAMYGSYRAFYKKSQLDAFENVSDKQDAYADFKTINPSASLRYRIPLRRKEGIYKVTIPYIDDYKFVKMLNNLNQLSTTALDEISWKETTSNESKITCR